MAASRYSAADTDDGDGLLRKHGHGRLSACIVRTRNVHALTARVVPWDNNRIVIGVTVGLDQLVVDVTVLLNPRSDWGEWRMRERLTFVAGTGISASLAKVSEAECRHCGN